MLIDGLLQYVHDFVFVLVQVDVQIAVGIRSSDLVFFDDTSDSRSNVCVFSNACVADGIPLRK